MSPPAFSAAAPFTTPTPPLASWPERPPCCSSRRSPCGGWSGGWITTTTRPTDMYFLMGIDTIIRIAAAMAMLFVAVPALALRRPAAVDRLQWFWLCFAAGTVALTLLGQLLTLVNA